MPRATSEHPTIAAVVTPIGQGGIGIVQVVGPEAVAIAGRVFLPRRGRDLALAPANTLHYGHVVEPNPPRHTIDEVIVRIGDLGGAPPAEQYVEINCHGGVAAVQATLHAVLDAGAQAVSWEQIPLRAFRTGRIDRVQLEAALALPTARTLLAAEMLAVQQDGALSTALERAMDSGEDCDVLQGLAATARLGIALCQPRRIVIAGRPNVGKSTLFNALLEQERALVHDQPGTTRDYVEAMVDIRGVPCVIVDTAGMRSRPGEVEAAGIALAEAQIQQADIVLLLHDSTEPLSEQDAAIGRVAEGKPTVLVRTKTDLPPNNSTPDPAAVPVAALERRGLDLLERQILLAAVGTDRPGCSGAMVFTQRQAQGIAIAMQDPPGPRAQAALHNVLRSPPEADVEA